MFWEAYHSLCLKIKKSPNTVAKEIGCSSGAVYDTLALNVFEDYARREIINRQIRIVAYIVFVALGVLFAFAFR